VICGVGCFVVLDGEYVGCGWGWKGQEVCITLGIVL